MAKRTILAVVFTFPIAFIISWILFLLGPAFLPPLAWAPLAVGSLFGKSCEELAFMGCLAVTAFAIGVLASLVTAVIVFPRARVGDVATSSRLRVVDLRTFLATLIAVFPVAWFIISFSRGFVPGQTLDGTPREDTRGLSKYTFIVAGTISFLAATEVGIIVSRRKRSRS